MSDNNLKGKMVSGMIWKFGERFIAQGVSFIVSLVIARILMPEDYGVVSIINIFIIIADVFLTSGLNSALIQKKDADETDFSTIFYCSLILGLTLYLLLFFTAPFISHMYKMPILKSALRVFALRLPISSFQSIQTAYVSKKMDFKKFFFSTITGTVISAVVGIIMALKGYGVWALIAQFMTNTIVDTIFLFFTVGWRPKLTFSWERAKPMISYGSRVMFTDLIGTVFNNAGDFLIGYKFSSADLAYYTKGRQLPTFFKTNITTTLISVLFPGISQVNDDKSKVKAISRKSVRILTFVIYPIMTGILILAEPITVFLLTEKWLPMVPFVIVVCVEAILSVPGTIALQTVKAFGRSDLMLKSELVKKPLLTISIIVALYHGVFAIALVLPINTFLDLVINGILTRKAVNYSLAELISDSIPATILSLVMGAAVYTITLIPFGNLLLELIVCTLAGAGIYILGSIVSKNSEFKTLSGIVMQKINNK